LAHKIRDTIPDSQGQKIADFLKALTVHGWQFEEIDEDTLKK
jgi:hypothetical protein